MLDKNLQYWFDNTKYGNYILSNELAFIKKATDSIFGYHALQLGLTGTDFLVNNKTVNHYHINKNIQFNINLLPFENNSLDCIICPHTLDINPNIEDIMAECYRVLIPKGKLIITGFNKISCFGLFSKKIFPNINFISANRLQHQLQSSGFQIQGGKFISYCPPFINDYTKFQIIDKIGDRWLPQMSNIYGLIASKDIITTNFIKPKSKPKISFQTQVAT